MSLGAVMLDIAGKVLTSEDRDLLRHPSVGGVIIFARNYESPQQLADLTASIRALRTPPLLIAVDQEGGRVQRFRDGFHRLPAAGEYGLWYALNPQAALRAAHVIGWLMAAELQWVGVDYSFAPVLDIDRGMNRAIGDRAFSHDPKTSALLATAWMQGARLAGMVSVAKHFPGHGGVSADSHLELPCDERSWETLWQEDLVPFQYLIQQGVEAVMPAHIVFPVVDRLAAGFSARWLQDILRQRMGFQGVIISDALDMLGAAAMGDDVTRAKAALAAGCDQLLACNNRQAAIKIVEGLANLNLPVAQARLLRLYHRQNFNTATPASLLQPYSYHPYWEEAEQILVQMDTLRAERATVANTYDPTTRGGQVV